MAPSREEILKDTQFNPDLLERIAFRPAKPPVEVVPPNPAWPSIFTVVKDRIASALGDKALAIHHYGSTSIPDLPAKDIIDIDLVVPDITNEDSYVPLLESAGFQFLTREPHWHEHRFFASYEPPMVNLHVWGPDCPEVERHRIFRDWLLKSDEDRALYAQVKEECGKATKETGGNTMDYNARKQDVVREIIRRAFRDLGYL